MFDIKRLYPAKDLNDALRALADDPESMVIAGGTDVLIRVREGKAAGASLVSIHELPELTGVRMEADGSIVIGACTSFARITLTPSFRSLCPIWVKQSIRSAARRPARRAPSAAICATARQVPTLPPCCSH